MRYLLTWIEGNDIEYRFVKTQEEIDKNLKESRHLIITPISE